jgi:hypothetical protein
MFKGIWKWRLEAHEVDDAISESIAWLKRHSAPFAFWWIIRVRRQLTWARGRKRRALPRGKSTRSEWPLN